MTAQPGDILLFQVGPGSPWLGKLIGWGQKVIGQAPTKAAYEHVALVSKPGWIIEAYWPRVREREFDPTGDSNIEVCRIKGLTSEQIQTIITAARQDIGTLYNISGLLTFGMVQLGHAEVCSQAVWKWATYVNLALCPYTTMISPDDIRASPLLV